MFHSHEETGQERAGGTTALLRQKYRGLRHLLAGNSRLLEMMADIEADLLHFASGERRFRDPVVALIDRTLLLVEDLNLLADGRYEALYESHRRIESEIRRYLRESSERQGRETSLMLADTDAEMVELVGGKAANLGEMMKVLPGTVPPGFVITTAAYRLFMQQDRLQDEMREQTRDLILIADRHLLKSRTEAIRSLIQHSPVPALIEDAIMNRVKKLALPPSTQFAVRSSAVGEDGGLSFAGQFDTFLNVSPEQLHNAYRNVLASRFSDRAVQYRLAAGSTEVDSPMAVLFQVMVVPRSAGVIYTRDPHDPRTDTMLINSVAGLAEQMVQGQANADIFAADRNEPGRVVREQLAQQSPSLTPADIKPLVETALEVEKHFGRPMDIEWAISETGRLMVLQARELRLSPADSLREAAREAADVPPLLSGGTTIFGGRAVGEAWVETPGRDIASVPQGAVMVVAQATPELAAALPRLAGLIAEHGNPAGHAATLVREFAVPCVFGIARATTAIRDGGPLSVDATRRTVFDGALWPDVQAKSRRRLHHPSAGRETTPLHERILALNLVDPQGASFRPKGCRSIHDIVRFVHEKAVAAMFEFGDQQVTRFGKAAKSLKTQIPLNILVLDLGGGLAAAAQEQKAVAPEDIVAPPFQALWRGIADPQVRWTGRTQVSAAGFASVVATSLAQPGPGRSLGSQNYLMVGSDYLCLNARLAYHFSMIDTMIGDDAENNYVNFRFRGGGAGADRRDFRALFLAQILLRSNFIVDRRNDLITAWLRRYPSKTCHEALSLLGKLMACARQLDMILDSAGAVREYADKFLQGDYEAFG